RSLGLRLEPGELLRVDGGLRAEAVDVGRPLGPHAGKAARLGARVADRRLPTRLSRGQLLTGLQVTGPGRVALPQGLAVDREDACTWRRVWWSTEVTRSRLSSSVTASDRELAPKITSRVLVVPWSYRARTRAASSRCERRAFSLASRSSVASIARCARSVRSLLRSAARRSYAAARRESSE